jgi:RNA polymerase sigma-70 factor (ECF subfamily)
MKQKERRPVREDPDVQLMLRFQDGDTEAFDALFQKYSPVVVNFVAQFLGNRARAEEIAQDVLLKVYGQQHQYEPTAKLSTWLFKIAHNHCLNEVRKREYKVRLEPVDPQGEEREPHLPSPQAGPDKVLEGEEVAAKIREILLAIPDNQRTAILLSRQEGMSYQEVAAVIGCTEKAVKSLVFRATQSLKAGLQDMGDEDDT